MTEMQGFKKIGTLCAGSFEPGNATYWEVRRISETSYVVYRTSVAVTEIGRYSDWADAYAEYHQHVGGRESNLEASLGG